MTFADLAIVIFVLLVVGVIIYNMTKKKDEGICSRCAYAKTCNDDCFPKKKAKIKN